MEERKLKCIISISGIILIYILYFPLKALEEADEPFLSFFLFTIIILIFVVSLLLFVDATIGD
jgi:Na+/melibiose symporter-like transporter